MTTGTTEVETAIASLVRALDETAGTGFSAVLYGSLARGDWHADHSDLNLLLVIEDPAPAVLGRLTAASRAWHEQGFTPPLIIGRAEWLRATDVFPVEITDMQGAYRLLAGDDPIADLRVDPVHLRRALEEALRGKLLRMRQAFLRFGEEPESLGAVAAASASELLVLLRTTAVLFRRAPATTPAEVVTAVQAELGPGHHAIREIIARRRTTDWDCPPELFATFLDALATLVSAVDRHSFSGGT